MKRECIRCGAPYDDQDINKNELLTETEKASCPSCRQRSMSGSRKSQSVGLFQKLLGLIGF